MNKFEIFREISIGELTKVQLLQKLIEAGIQFNKYADIVENEGSWKKTDTEGNFSNVIMKRLLNCTEGTPDDDIGKIKSMYGYFGGFSERQRYFSKLFKHLGVAPDFLVSMGFYQNWYRHTRY